jgi:hypothetical protein
MSGRHYDRAEQQLEDDLRDGRISQADYDDELKAMARDEREDMEEAAWNAAQDVRDNW